MAYKAIICPVCGSSAFHNDGQGNYVCESCRTTFVDENLSGDIGLVSGLLDSVDFGAAENVCRDKLQENPNNPQLNWLMFLAKNKIHFVSDPVSGERKPVFYGNRVFGSGCCVYDDVNYQHALQGRYVEQYRRYGELIEAIRIELWEKVSGEYDTDIFVSFRSDEEMTDGDGNKRKVETFDYKKAEEIYNFFTKQGYKVFFSPVSIGRGNVLGEKYEPKIFGALASAKAMILVGTKSAYVNSGWVRDEWTRYLYFMDKVSTRSTSRLKKAANTLFYVFDRRPPQDLPSQIAEIQGIDCSSVSYLEELHTAVRAKIGNPGNGIERVTFAEGQSVRKQRAEVEQIATVALGSGAVGKKKVVEAGALQIKDFGANRVQAYTANEKKILDGAFASLEVGNFKFAEHEFDEILSNGDNARALLGKLFVSVGAKNKDEFVKFSEDVTAEQAQIFARLMACADKDEANQAADLFVAACKHCCLVVNPDKVLLYFQAVAVYNIPQRQQIIDVVNAFAPDMVQSHNACAKNVADAVLSSIDPQKVDECIAYCLEVAQVAIQTGSFSVAEYFDKKVLAMDETNHDALFNELCVKLNVRNKDEIAKNIVKLPLDDVKYIVEHSSADQAKKDIVFFTEAYVKQMRGEHFADVADCVKLMLSYDFPKRGKMVDKFAEAVVKNGPDNLEQRKFAAIVDYVTKLIDGNDVDKHIAFYISAADRACGKQWFVTAEKLYKKAVDLDNGNMRALQGALYASVGSSDGSIVSQVDKFADKSGNAVANLENLLRFAKQYDNKNDDEDDDEYEWSYNLVVDKSSKAIVNWDDFLRFQSSHNGEYKKSIFMSVLDKFCDDIITALEENKTSVEIANKAYLNVIRYIPTEYNGLMSNKLFVMGDLLLRNGEFALADKYFSEMLTIDGDSFSALWGRVLAENECANDAELEKTLVDYSETQSYIRAYRAATAETQLKLNDMYQRWSSTLDKRKADAAEAEKKRIKMQKQAEKMRLTVANQKKALQEDQKLLDSLLSAVGVGNFAELIASKRKITGLKQYTLALSNAQSKVTVEKLNLLAEMQRLYVSLQSDLAFYEKNKKYLEKDKKK